MSQQKLADLMDVKRGKVAGYFYETQAKADFHKRLISHFHLDLGRFLTLEMDDENYESFFSTISDEITTIHEPEEEYKKTVNAIDLLLRAKQSEDKLERDQLIDQAISVYGQLISESSQLKDQLMKALQQK
ncbi:MAG: hypothetical protein ABJG78_09685 [Cyclobacteriaceae bacterium]